MIMMMRNRRMRWLFLAPLAILGFVIFLAIGGQVIMQLWNWLLPTLFGWRLITFWQALGLLALCRILFGGLGGGGGRSNVRRRMAERWDKMSPEEREKFRNSCRGRWGSFEPPDS